ncbi:hypothetical protein KHP62_14730 [Rhodobacteraceae bacterium NNCM2]|nr:hypothetical protein [Coraliihabitans acroporae]
MTFAIIGSWFRLSRVSLTMLRCSSGGNKVGNTRPQNLKLRPVSKSAASGSQQDLISPDLGLGSPSASLRPVSVKRIVRICSFNDEDYAEMDGK